MALIKREYKTTGMLSILLDCRRKRKRINCNQYKFFFIHIYTHMYLLGKLTYVTNSETNINLYIS
jgi:hypothetical protein